jgi:PEP-CTERM motif
MKTRTICSILSLAAVLSLAASASATTILLDSNSSTVQFTGYTGPGTIPSGFEDIPNTFNLCTNDCGGWASAIGTSDWVSFNPYTAPNSDAPGTYYPYSAPNGTYDYSDTFQASSSSSGTISVLADDTISIYLNGNLIVAAAGATQSICAASTPNCTTVATYTLPTADFADGTNVLSFDVQQLFGGATGLDFEGTLSTSGDINNPPAPSPTPEPSSIFMLGTGLLAAAGTVRRRLLV